MNKKPAEKLHKIKDFASSFGVTVKALKVYENYGIFAPAYIDEFTKYRYYSQEQIPELSRILSLRDAGFSLKEIKDFLDGQISMQTKMDSLFKQREIIDTAIEQLSVFTKKDEGYTPKIKILPAHHAYTIKYLAKTTDDIINRFSLFNDEMIASNLQFDRHIQAYAIFHDTEFRITDISLSLCSIVSKKGKNTVYKPPQKVVSVLHLGDYSKLSEAYMFLSAYCEKNNSIISGDPIEYYLTGTGIKSLADFTLTEVCFPIE